MTTSLQRKHQKVFTMFDTNGDGRIELSDLHEHAAKTYRRFGISPDSPKAAALKRRSEQVWRELSKLDKDNDQAVTMPEFVAGYDQQFYNRCVEPLLDAYFDIYDADGDGSITEQELVRVFEIDKEPTSAAREAFAALDADGDGQITRTEYHAACREALTTDNPDSPANLILGKL